MVVTRPREQAAGLAERIEAKGGRAIVFPAIEIVRRPESAAQAIAALQSADIAVFVSPTAARVGLELVGAHGGWPSHVAAAAVGPGTERVLHAGGVTRIVSPSEGADSEALLALPELARMEGRRAVLFRGRGGRELMGETLRARGAAVEYIECYDRRVPGGDAGVLLSSWDAGEVDAVTVFSSEALDNLALLLGAAGGERLRTTPLFATHARIGEHARGLGIREVRVGGPGDADLVRCLVAYFRDGK